MTTIHARAGDILTCQDGHPVALFTRDVYLGDLYREGDLDFLWRDTPKIGEEDAACYCGHAVLWNSWGVLKEWPGDACAGIMNHP